MRTIRHRLLVGAFAWLVCAACRPDDAAPPSLASFSKTTVTLETATGTHTIEVWIADTPSHREQGLMFVKSLPPDAGMLFVFDEAQYVAMWMKDTYISLDMVFIDRGSRVANIAANTKPLSLDTINSATPVMGVLELPAGAARRFGLHPGDRVHSPAFRL